MRKLIVEKYPETSIYFEKYLDGEQSLLIEEEVYEGKKTYSISDLADQMRGKGACGLFSGVGTGKTEEETLDNLIILLTKGFLSTQDRYDQGIFQTGSSEADDHGSNGADQVFTRLITTQNASKEKKMTEFMLSGQSQVFNKLKRIK